MAGYLFAHFTGEEKDGENWCLIADQFMEGKGYLPMLTKDLASGDFRILTPDEYDMGRTKKRHGGILQITDEEYESLCERYGGEALKRQGFQ